MQSGYYSMLGAERGRQTIHFLLQALTGPHDSSPGIVDIDRKAFLLVGDLEEWVVGYGPNGCGRPCVVLVSLARGHATPGFRLI